jgi:hypothetical protein
MKNETAMFPVEPSIYEGLWAVDMSSYDLPALTFRDKEVALMVSVAMERLVASILEDTLP